MLFPEKYKTVFVGGPLHTTIEKFTPKFLYDNRLLMRSGWTYQLQSVMVGKDDWYFYYAMGPSTTAIPEGDEEGITG